jgi:hypothetical protein
MAIEVPRNELHIPTVELISKLNPSLTSFFSIYINDKLLRQQGRTFGGTDTADVNFVAYEAVLPGTSFELGQVFGDMQGFTEQYPTKRVYPPIDVSFYVNIKGSTRSVYPVITYFENWMQSIFEIKGGGGIRYGRFNYPDSYECDIVITKFERDFRDKNSKLNSKGDAGYVSLNQKCTYTLRNAYPTNIIALPVSYSQSDVLRTTITFNYDYYSYDEIKYS